MDSPPPSAPSITGAPPPHINYPDSVDSSPRSRNNDLWDDSLPSHTPKLRFMCSYGGRIVPRPHDRSLCYVGGETRIVVSDRTTSLTDLSARLPKTFLNDRPFTIKYQLPSEDLDSLISLSTDEDLENMIEEYDRTMKSPKPARLRLFLFPLKPESSQSIGSLLDNSSKSDDWFLNALNGAGLINGGLSDSASVDCLLGLDVKTAHVNTSFDNNSNHCDVGGRDVEASQPGSFANCRNVKQEGQDIHSVLDSPLMSSSFGSTSSAPSLANLPPIRVHVEDVGGVRVQDQNVGIEKQFAHMSFGVTGQKPDEGFVLLASPHMPPIIQAVPVSSEAVSVEFDGRSEHGVPVGHPQPQSKVLLPQSQQKPNGNGGSELPSPHSVSSDNSNANAMSGAKPVVYQESIVQIPPGTTRISANPADQKINISDPNSQIQIQQQAQDSGYMLQPHFEQQQFVHAGTHYIQHHPPGPVQIAYYPVYPSQQHHRRHQLEQQYPVYYVSAKPTQPYNLSVQPSNISESATTVPTSHPQTPPNPATMVASPTTFTHSRNASVVSPDMAAGMYRMPTAAAPQYVQVPQNQQQYIAYSQIHHPSQSVTPGHASNPNYAYEIADHAHSQIYYNQPLPPTLPAQYQAMTAATAVGFPEASAQPSKDNMNQQITSQPI